MSIAVIGGGIRQRPGVRKAQPHSPCCKNELLTSDSKASCLGGVSELAMIPALIRSRLVMNTVGMVVVAALAASASGAPPTAAITATSRRTRSAASN